MKKKYSVVSLGSRDHYHVALALKKSGMLKYYITDFYTPNFLKFMTTKRFDINLSSRLTISTIYILFPLTFLKYINKKFNIVYDNIFGFFSAAICFLTNSNAVVYSYYATGFNFFITIFNVKIEYIVFQVHPINQHVKPILKKYCDNYSFKYEKDRESIGTEKNDKNIIKYLNNCKGIIVASKFNKDGLVLSGIKNLKIQVSAYGADVINVSKARKKEYHTDKKIKLLWVGQLVQRKGFYFLEKALDKIDKDLFEIIIVSRNGDKNLISHVRDKYGIKSATKKELSELFLWADLLVLPSLIEGFGLVYLESIAHGTPFLCSDNTGGKDILDKHYVGQSVVAGDYLGIKEKIEFLIANPDELNVMNKNCDKAINDFSWNNFHNNTIKIIKNFEKSTN